MPKSHGDLLERFLRPQPQPKLDLVGAVPDGLCPQPLPMSIVCSTVTSADGRQQLVVMQVATPSGVQFYLMDAALAQTVSDNLATVARRAASDIVVVPRSP